MSNFHSFGDIRGGGNAPAPKPGTVTVIENDDQYVSVVNACSKTGQLTAVDMNAQWCAPCKSMKPVFHKLAEEFKDVFFLDVDVEKCQDSARKAGVSSIPAFLFFKGTQQVDELVGANPGKLRQIIEKHHVPAPTGMNALPGGKRLGEADAPMTADASIVNGLMDMGFSEDAAKKAAIAVKNAGILEAIDWITAHPEASAQPAMTDAPPPYQPPQAQFHSQPQPQPQPQQLTPEMMAAFLSAAATASGINGQQPPQQPAQQPAQQQQPAAPLVEHDALCDYCKRKIVGVRYKCTVCPDFDMCEECRNKGLHDSSHNLITITQNIRPRMTQAEIDLKTQQLRQKAQEQRMKEEEEEKQRKKMQELERRRAGKDLQEAKERFEQSQARKADIARKKEAQADIAAKERVRKLIEQDKIERHARLAGEDPEAAAAAANGIRRPKEHIVVPMKPTTTIPIQIRLPDGTYIKNEFSKSATIYDLYTWARANRTDTIPPEMRGFALFMVAPRREFNQRDMSLTLEQADLAPSASLILSNRRG